jgi:D-sedoheptulose 7-phosphate isomerase
MDSQLEMLLQRYPVLSECEKSILDAYRLIVSSYEREDKLLLCGNGGSAADCEHITGELMKEYLLPRPLPADIHSRLTKTDPEIGPALAGKLQGSLPAINLAAVTSLLSAFGNDVKPEYGYAQATYGYGKRGDVLLGISTSGNALNVRAALCAARAIGISTVGLTGKGGGKMAGLCDVLIAVPASRTFEVQELHLPVYHCLCAMMEQHFWGKA